MTALDDLAMAPFCSGCTAKDAIVALIAVGLIAVGLIAVGLIAVALIAAGPSNSGRLSNKCQSLSC